MFCSWSRTFQDRLSFDKKAVTPTQTRTKQSVIAVKTRRELKKNLNILLSSVALADLLVGAVSMPLTITLDTLVIQRVLVVDIICTIDFISVSVLHTGCWASFFHLLLIAWERYVAIAKLAVPKFSRELGRVSNFNQSIN